MVNITDVKQILQLAIDAEIKVFLDGGWGVDALLGHQSRVHNDIDILVEKKDYQNFIEIMKANDFYEIKMEYTTSVSYTHLDVYKRQAVAGVCEIHAGAVDRALGTGHQQGTAFGERKGIVFREVQRRWTAARRL